MHSTSKCSGEEIINSSRDYFQVTFDGFHLLNQTKDSLIVSTSNIDIFFGEIYIRVIQAIGNIFISGREGFELLYGLTIICSFRIHIGAKTLFLMKLLIRAQILLFLFKYCQKTRARFCPFFILGSDNNSSRFSGIIKG